MGLADRDYYRDEHRGINIGGDWSAVATLMAINAAVFLVGMFTSMDLATGRNWVQENLALEGDLFKQPWQAWQLLTYGFVHAGIWHIAFNMFGLWFFGRDVEVVYGRQEFYKLYLSLLILAGLVFALIQFAHDSSVPVVGASGAVMGVAVIFACHFPRRAIYIIPFPFSIPAVVLVAFYIVMDLIGAQNQQSEVAHWAHLGGAAFGFLYYKTGWNLFRLWPRGWAIKLPRRGPKLRVHREVQEEDEPADDYLTTGRLQQRVDQLLEKISRSGESSLTDEERKFLADASRRYQQQKRR